MNEVEKLMQNANIEKEFAYLECHRGRSSICCPIDECEKDDKCIGCINSSAMEEVYKYPPFTAEKQLEITKFLLYKGVYYAVYDNRYWFHIDDDCENRGYKPFEEAIAECINNLWQDLTDAEKAQIKEILE